MDSIGSCPFAVALNENPWEDGSADDTDGTKLGNVDGAEDTGDKVVGKSVVGSSVVGAIEAVGVDVGTAEMVGDKVGESVTQKMLGQDIIPQHSAMHASFVV